MVSLRGLVDFEPNQGNLELKLFTMDAKFNLKGLQRKKVEKNHKDDQRDLESILDRMDNFLTSDTLENLSQDKMYANYGFINDGATFLRNARSQIQ